MRRWRRQKRRESCAKTTQPIPVPPSGTQMIVPRVIATYLYFPERRFLTTMSVKTMTTKNRVKLHKGHSAKYTPPTPKPPVGRQIMVPIWIMAYQSLPDRRFTTTMSLTTMMENKRWKLHKLHSTHTRSSRQEADDSAQRDYDWPIHSPNLTADDYDRNDDDDK